MNNNLLQINFKRAEMFPQSQRERRKLVPLVALLVHYQELALKGGILALETRIYDEKLFVFDTAATRFLKQSLGLAVDGTEPYTIKTMGTAQLHSHRWSGIQLLALTIILESVLIIQRGDHPIKMKENLLCWIGFMHDHEVQIQLDTLREQTLTEHRAQLDNFESKFLAQENQSQPNLLDRMIDAVDVTSIESFITPECIEPLGFALYACTRESSQKLITSCSVETRYTLLESIQSFQYDWCNASTEPKPDARTYELEYHFAAKLSFERAMEKAIHLIADRIVRLELIHHDISIHDPELFAQILQCAENQPHEKPTPEEIVNIIKEIESRKAKGGNRE